MATGRRRHAPIVGEHGVVETGYSTHAPAGGILPLRVGRGAPDPSFEAVEVPGGDGFRAEAFACMVRLAPRHWDGATEAESIDAPRRWRPSRRARATALG